MQQISLIHPIYLDVPMLVSFAAALQGGLSFGTEVTCAKASTQAEATKIEGELGLSKLFSSLFQASLKAEGSDLDEARSSEVRKESKAHTEASIAIVLYDQLRRSPGHLVQPQDAAQMATLMPGTLVELNGTMLKNPVDAMIDYIDAINILSGIDQKSLQVARQTKSQGGRSGAHSSGDPQLLRVRELLDRDRRRTPISNVQLKCSCPADMTAVITLRTQNLRDLTLSELNKNTVRVVGKITRAVGAGETMSAFENYGMAMLSPALLQQIFTQLASTENIVVEFSDIAVRGPAVQILPLMVFV